MPTSVLSLGDLQRLLDSLSERGYEVVGPVIRDSAIVYEPIQSTADLPVGYRESQGGGRYRLATASTNSLFAYTLGPQSWKRFLLPPEHQFLLADRSDSGFTTSTPAADPPKRAFLGVRACELAALAILDKVFMGGPYVDNSYSRRREQVFIIAVNCTRAGDTCFCASMHTGPRAKNMFDLAITEITDGDQPTLLIESGSKRGEVMLGDLDPPVASDEQLLAAEEAIAGAESSMGRRLETDRLPELLVQLIDDRHWDEIAKRCLSCGNCTMVCPTCFCSTTEDSTDLSGRTATRLSRLDSCHTTDFSYIHGGSVRTSVMSRYRQWMMHKLAYWPEQFDTFGCVGCGRCITWCPVGIDITEEAASFRTKVSR